MAKKSLICGLAMVVLLLFCGICFAADDGNSISLGNEVMRSIDKTGNSFRNVVSGNVVNGAVNNVREGTNNVENGLNDVVNGNDRNNNAGNRDYNTVRTTTEGTTTNGTAGTMTATTWMWLILIVAAVIIIAAIWYYATQSNS